MPVVLAALAAILIVILLWVLLVPVTIVQRYRTGTARRRARSWMAAFNAAGIGLSIAVFLTGAALTNLWIPNALLFTVGGLLGGGVLGIAGLALTRWEPSPYALYYTPNRWLVLAITVAVAGRIFYGFWRSWLAWTAPWGGFPAAAATGAAGALAAGALILGYYFVYWTGVRRRAARLVLPPSPTRSGRRSRHT